MSHSKFLHIPVPQGALNLNTVKVQRNVFTIQIDSPVPLRFIQMRPSSKHYLESQKNSLSNSSKLSRDIQKSSSLYSSKFFQDSQKSSLSNSFWLFISALHNKYFLFLTGPCLIKFSTWSVTSPLSKKTISHIQKRTRPWQLWCYATKNNVKKDATGETMDKIVEENDTDTGKTAEEAFIYCQHSTPMAMETGDPENEDYRQR